MTASSKTQERKAFPAGNAKVGDTVLVRIDISNVRRWCAPPWKRIRAQGGTAKGVVTAVGVGETGRSVLVQFDDHPKPAVVSTFSDACMLVRIVPKKWPKGLRRRLAKGFCPARRQVNSDEPTFMVISLETLYSVYSRIQTVESAELYVNESGEFFEGKPEIEDCFTVYTTDKVNSPRVFLEEIDPERYQ